MNIVIFGANGATGQLLTRRSLDAGHTVAALVRRPSSFSFRDRVHIVEGSVFELEPVLQTLRGAEAVFSALGAHTPFRNENVLPRAVPVIVQAMQHTGVRRIIALGSAGALPEALAKQPAWRRWLAHKVAYPILKWPVYEQQEQYRVLSASGLDWTMVLPPILTNGPARRRYRIDGEALPPNTKLISRADVADFMFQQLTSSEWLRCGVYVAN